MAHVLVLTQVLPFPPDSGPKVKTWNLLKYLAREHQVTLASFVRGDQSADVQGLLPLCAGGVHTVPITRGPVPDGLAMLRSLATGRSWMMLRDDRAEMHGLIARLCRQRHFDVVHADQLNMCQFAERVDATRMLDAHNALWLLYQRLAATMPNGPRRWLLERDWRLLKADEGRWVREFDGVLAVSEEDRVALLEAAGVEREVVVVPIAVDADELPVVSRAPRASHITHIGTMYWPPNIDGMLWFIREIYPSVRARRPEVKFDLIGSRPPQELVALKSEVAGLNVTGYVADLHPFLAQCGVFIVPLRAGGGMRVKILEALARGLPVVTTSLGCEGIAVRHGEHVLIADTPEAFADAVVAVLADPALASRLGVSGRRLIETHYDYRAACRPIDRLYQQPRRVRASRQPAPVPDRST